MNSQTPEQQAAALLNAGRAREALAVIEPAASAADASHTALARKAAALKALGRMGECLAVRRLAAARYPASGIAWHNLASALGDAGDSPGAAEACVRAFAAGLDAPETHLIYGRALAGTGDLAAAVSAFDQALRRRAGYPEALAEKSRAVLALTGDIGQAAAVYPSGPAGALNVAELYRSLGETGRALAIVASAAGASPGDPGLQQALAGLALAEGQDHQALAAARAALRLAPNDPVSLQAFAIACLAAGRAEEALASARALAAAPPADGTAIALLATAARLAGSTEYAQLYDYQAFVQTFDIAAPSGWVSTPAFLAELKAALEAIHAHSIQPHEQSLRGGTQTTRDLRVIDNPAIKGFFAAVDAPVRAYMAALGAGGDPLRSRNTGAYAISDCWSIRLRSEGHHVDHLHPRGWLSSAFYVDLPDEITADADGQGGWLRFGRPSWRTVPPLEAAHGVQPVAGRLVLFPSYMWHGTTPFVSGRHRLTIAFDIVPV